MNTMPHAVVIETRGPATTTTTTTATRALPLSVVPASSDDIPALVDIYFAAFRDDFDDAPIVPEVSREFWIRDLLDYLSDPSVYVSKAVKEIDGVELILGWALWALHNGSGSDSASSKSSSVSDSDSDLNSGSDLEAGWWSDEEESWSDEFQIFERTNASSTVQPIRTPSWSGNNTQLTRKPYWHLEVVAVSPEYERRGIDAQLLEHVLLQADEMGFEIRAEIDTRTSPLYRGFGFQEQGCIGRFSNTSKQDHHLIMTRQPDIAQRLKEGVGHNYY